jgi:hypothetical protein
MAGLHRSEFATRLGFRYEGPEYYQLFFDPRDEVDFSRALLKRVATEYTAHPALFAGCVAKNVFNFWFLGRTWMATQLNILAQGPLLVLALAGVGLLWKRRLLCGAGIMLMFAFYVMAVEVPIIGYARHSVPATPFLAIPASVSLVWIWQKCRTLVNKGTYES